MKYLFEKAIINLIISYENRDGIIRRDEMSKLFIYLIEHEPNGKVLNNKEIGQLKKIFFGNEKNIVTTGISELIGLEIYLIMMTIKKLSIEKKYYPVMIY